MANKILAAVLSLGAVMSNGSVSSARESSASESSNKNSDITVLGGLSGKSAVFVKRALDIIQREFGLKDAFYLLLMKKIYDSLSVPTPSLESVLPYLDNKYDNIFLEPGSKEYIAFYNAQDSGRRFIMSSRDHLLTSSLKNKLIATQLKRLDNLLSVEGDKEDIKNEQKNKQKNTKNEQENKQENEQENEQEPIQEVLVQENIVENIIQKEVEEVKEGVASESTLKERFKSLPYFKVFKEVTQVESNEQNKITNLELAKDDVSSQSGADSLDILTTAFGDVVLYCIKDNLSGSDEGCLRRNQCLLDDLSYLFKFTDKEILSYLKANDRSLECFFKLDLLVDTLKMMKSKLFVDPNNAKKWDRFAERIKKISSQFAISTSMKKIKEK